MSGTLSQAVVANAPWVSQMGGSYFRIISAPTPVDAIFYRQGAQIMTITGMDNGFYCRPAGGFDRVDVLSAVNQTIKTMVLDGDGGYDHFNVDITSALQAVAVNIAGNASMSVVQAGTLNDAAPVSVGVAATLLLAASATRKGARFTNAGTVPVYLGGAGVTVANAAIIIQPGQTWIESEAAPAAWYGISGSAAQSVKVQELQP